MQKPARLSENEKLSLIKTADETLSVPFYVSHKFWLAARWIEETNSFAPVLVTPSMFDNHEDLELVTFYYKPKTFVPDGWDMEPEHLIVTGSIDPKSGRRRVVIDTTKKPVQAAPIKNQVDWRQVAKFSLPPLDEIENWSRKQDDEVTSALIDEGHFRPESKSMAVRVEGMDTEIRYNPRLIPHALIAKRVHELELKYPESEFDEYLSRCMEFQDLFGQCQSGSIVLEWMRSCAPDVKNSVLRTLYETGQFEDFPFKIRATALLMSRGYTIKESASEIFLDQVMGFTAREAKPGFKRQLPDQNFERMRWIYSESDFQRYRSIVENFLTRLLNDAPFGSNSKLEWSKDVSLGSQWDRFDLAWGKLSKKQQQAATLLKMNGRQSTFQSAAAELKIGVESLKERWNLVKRRFRQAFPEFKHFHPSKSFTNSKKGSFIYWGLYWPERAAVIHEVRHERHSDACREVTISVPKLYKGPKRKESNEFMRWQKEHKFKMYEVAKLDEPVDLEAFAQLKKRSEKTTGRTPDLWDVFRPGASQGQDLSIASPADDEETPAQPGS